MTTNKITVLVVDDSSFMRNMLPRLIQRDERFEVIGTAKDGREGVEKTLELKPDIVTMDIEMPIMNGIEALEEIMRKSPRPVLMISSLTEAGAKATIEALDKGAVDFIPKALDNQENSIIKMAGVLHEKLIAATQVRMGRPSPSPSLATKPIEQKAPVEVVSAPTSTYSSVKRLDHAKILIIGSSTGGPRALQSIVPFLLKDLRVPVVIAQHMPPGFTQAMAKRLNEISQVKVCEAVDGQELENGCVYIAPGGMHMRVKVSAGGKNALSIMENKGESLYKPSVDVLAESLLDIMGKNVLAVMLTGMGEDGAKNFVNLKNKGSYVIAQDEASSTVYGMPRAVYEKGGASEVLTLEAILPRINMLLS